jgi:hypothetical protein
MKAYYNGFSFDGQTRVYNPYSTLLFFASSDKVFDKYWVDTATSDSLVDFVKDKRLRVEQFPGQTVFRSFARAPGALDQTDAMGFLYQAGYLTLRPAPEAEVSQGTAGGSHSDDGVLVTSAASDNSGQPIGTKAKPPTTREKCYLLDYPNQEVRVAMSELALKSNLGAKEANTAKANLIKAFDQGNVDGLVDGFNKALAGADYAGYFKSSDPANPEEAEKPPDENQFRALLSVFLCASGLKAFPEVHSGRGRADMAIVGRGRLGRRVEALGLPLRRHDQSQGGLGPNHLHWLRREPGRSHLASHGRQQARPASEPLGVPTRLGWGRQMEKSGDARVAPSSQAVQSGRAAPSARTIRYASRTSSPENVTRERSPRLRHLEEGAKPRAWSRRRLRSLPPTQTTRATFLGPPDGKEAQSLRPPG